MRKTFLILSLFITACLQLNAQQVHYNFRHFTPNDGLSNDGVRGIAEDNYGFIWFGTNYGLNRFDGKKVKKYFYQPDDSTSVSNNFVRSLFGDSRGRIWIGGDPGFSLYDYKSDHFIRYDNADANIQCIAEDKTGRVWVGTNRGLRYADTIQKQLTDVSVTDTSLHKLLKRSIRDIFCGEDKKIYLATGAGVIILDWETKNWMLISKKDEGESLISSNDIQNITVDQQNRLWITVDIAYSSLYRVSADRKSSVKYDYFQKQGDKLIPNSVKRIMADHQGRIWVGSTYKGLSLFDEKNNSFISYMHDPVWPNSFATFHCTQIYQDKTGLIWTGTEGSGVDYFHPEQGLFWGIQYNPYMPFSLLDNWGRVAIEDKDHNLWLGTGKGVSVYNHKEGVIRNFTNTDSAHKQISNQSVRSLLYDKDGLIWIGTADGVCRYDPAANKMYFFTEKDSLINGFTWVLSQVRNGNVIVGSTAGLFEYSPLTKKFYSYRKDPVIGKYISTIRAFKEDSKGRWWIGFFSNGLLVYDPVKKEVIKRIFRDSANRLSSNFIHSFCEDKEGNMWIGTRVNLTCYNLEKDSSVIYGLKEGIPNNWISGLRFDRSGRLWIGTGKGLCVMNKDKKIVRVFGLEDGLQTTQFNEQDIFETQDGLFVFPTHKGFIFCRPEQFNWKQEEPPVYITSLKVLNKELKDSVNLEELKSLQLAYDQNFLSFELTGLNYSNPGQCWYAYKLDGFDKDWIYTQEELVNYTNIPGGDYIFHYKVSLDPYKWDVEEKTLQIHIDTVFYKTWWFLLLVIAVVILAFYLFMRFRISNAKKVTELQGKAQLLEKEKTVVQYESLKQQLNPHFLFNSLTSLGSLIQVDPKMAGDFLEGLSKTYRYILKSRDNETVSLGDEIKFAETFVRLQKTRFGEGLQVKFVVIEEFFHRKIVPVTIQNLIENAIKHNIIDDESPLTITVFVEDDYLVVQNNLQKKKFVETSNKQGLANLQSLYHYLSSRKLLIQEEAEYFTVKIPLI